VAPPRDHSFGGMKRETSLTRATEEDGGDSDCDRDYDCDAHTFRFIATYEFPVKSR